MTPGVTQETVDGMSQAKIGRIIDALRHERYRFRRSGGSTSRRRTGRRVRWGCRPGRTNSSAKWSACCWRRTTSRHSPTGPTGSVPVGAATPRCGRSPTPGPGRPGSSKGTSPTASGQLDHEVMLSNLAEKIHDNRFLRLVRNMLTAGYLEDWEWGATLSGAPQGGVRLPILSNIYLHRLDEFVETVLIPEYTRGERRARNPAYLEVQNQLAQGPPTRRPGHGPCAASADASACPARIPDDPGYRRLRYCRYADDHLLGFTGPKAEAEEIKQRLAEFLRDELKLELSQDKTLITHARTGAARFLGYEITVQHNDTQDDPRPPTRQRRRSALRVPTGRDQGQVRPLPARAANPRSRTALINGERPHHRRHLRGRYTGASSSTTCWPETSTGCTGCTGSWRPPCSRPWPASTARQCRRWPPSTRPRSRHRTGCAPASRPASNATAGSHWSHGSVEFRSNGRRTAVLTDRQPIRVDYPQKELVTRLLADTLRDLRAARTTCKCTTSASSPTSHDPDGRQPEWAQLMANRRRKTLVVCAACHDRIHAGQAATPLTQ